MSQPDEEPSHAAPPLYSKPYPILQPLLLHQQPKHKPSVIPKLPYQQPTPPKQPPMI
ncbi:hypothetical protein [Bartonella senegalensis]|uniref:hypothetical protein n=1 Tax=Bartonella senegalensis TaxID=1468418 RepID=UPI00030DF610|nr:hypothetical protein [Bartonella senegalensis]